MNKLNIENLLYFQQSGGGNAQTLANSTTYIYRVHGNNGTNSTIYQRNYVPKKCKIKRVIIYNRCTNVSSNEPISWYIRVNDTDDYLIATVSEAVNERLIDVVMDLELNEGDFFHLKLVTPAWSVLPGQQDNNWTILMQ